MTSASACIGISVLAALAHGAESARPILVPQSSHRLGGAVAVAFSADDHFVATGGGDGTARLWVAATGELIRLFQGQGAVSSVAFSPDGIRLITGDSDDTLRAWDSATGRELWHVKGATLEVSHVEFSPDGQSILAVSDEALTLRNPANGAVTQLIDDAEYSTATFSHDGRFIAGTTTGGMIRMWNVQQRPATSYGEWKLPPISERFPVPDQANTIALSRDNQWITVGTRQLGEVWLVDTRTAGVRKIGKHGNAPNALKGGSISVTGAAFRPDGSSLITAGRDGVVRVWAIPDGKQLREAQLAKDYQQIHALSLSHSGTSLLTASGAATLTDIESFTPTRTFGGTIPFVFSANVTADARLVVIATQAGSSVWDLTVDKEIQRLGNLVMMPMPGVVQTSANGKWLFTPGPGNRATLSDIRTKRVLARPQHQSIVLTASLSASGQVMATGDVEGNACVWKAPSGQQVICVSDRPNVPDPDENEFANAITSVAIPQSACCLLTGSDNRIVTLWSIATGKKIWTTTVEKAVLTITGAQDGVALSHDGRLFTIGRQIGQLMRTSDRQVLGRIATAADDYITYVKFSNDDRHVVAVTNDGKVIVANTRPPVIAHEVTGPDCCTGVAEFLDDRHVLIGGAGGIRVTRIADGEVLATLLLQSASAQVVDPDGRFDTDLAAVAGFRWVFPDDPFRPLPLEIFTRDYYEPQLLTRLLTGRGDALRPLPPLAALNRIQPEVKIASVRPGAHADEVLVDVTATGKTDLSQRNGKTHTEAYDLRLFRNGQLVGQWPAAKDSAGDATDLDTWRKNSHAVPTAGSTQLPPFKVRLAARDRGKPVTFTAYAFNEDRVKSLTDTRDDYKVPPEVAPRPAHAYIVTIGVNEYENPHRNLRYAVGDAKALATAFARLEGYQVVPLSLLSEGGDSPSRQATKANIRDVLQLLSGRNVDRKRLRNELGAAVDALAGATPDDLVVLSFSGHGHTERNGQFFLLPSDSGTNDDVAPADLPHLISSQELSEWLRGINAGQTVLIVDACYAASATDGGDEPFKPGPMGDRGLGQLAYDKGMRILAAAQASDVALESDRLGQGLLTYALVQAGLNKRRADPDRSGRITLLQLLQYAESEVPQLYQDVLEGKRRIRFKGQILDSKETRTIAKRAQTPKLYDFYRQGDDVVIWRRL